MPVPPTHDLLYLDDRKLTRDYWASRLGSAGVKLRAVGSIAEGLAEVRHRPPDAVLLESRIGTESGLDAIAQLRRCESISDVPIFLTLAPEAVNRRHLLHEALHLGASDLLFKPLDPELFLRKLRTHLRIRQYSRERMRFVSMLTQDLNGPITSVLGFSRLLLDGEFGGLRSQEAVDAVASIFTAGERLRRQISQFLYYARLESGNLPFELGECCLSKVLDAALAELADGGLTPEQGVNLLVPDDLAPVHADARELQTALQEILRFSFGNHRYREGPVTVSLRPAEAGGMVLCRIADGGIGYTGEQLGALFDRYSSITTPSSVRDAFGMGLLVARAIIEAHGGSITIESEPGEGSIVEIALPTARAAPQLRATATPD